MNERDWVLEADEYLRKKYVEFVASRDDCSAELPEYSPPLALWEAKYFMLGLEKSLFDVDQEKSYVQTDILRNATKKNGKQQKTIQLIWNKSGKEKVGLFREGVCQMATASYLSIHHNWDVSEIEIEPANGVDILLKENQNTIVCCEVKSNKKEFDTLILGFKYCCERGDHKRDECKYEKDHPKFAMCYELQPKYFHAVSPEEKQCFELGYADGKIQLHPIDKLPTKAEYLRKHSA